LRVIQYSLHVLDFLIGFNTDFDESTSKKYVLSEKEGLNSMSTSVIIILLWSLEGKDGRLFVSFKVFLSLILIYW
jgi:hypothetical protein